MGSKLRERFIREVLSDSDNLYSFFKSLDSEESTAIQNLCKWIISTIEYNDNPGVVKEAFSKLAHLRDLPSFSELKKLESTWQNTYNNEYEYLMFLFENANKGQRCNCEVYQDGRFNVPPYQDDLDEVGRDVREYEDYMKTDLIHVKCKICKMEWEVEVDYSYHYRFPKLRQSWTLESVTDVRFLLHRGLLFANSIRICNESYILSTGILSLRQTDGD